MEETLRRILEEAEDTLKNAGVGSYYDDMETYERSRASSMENTLEDIVNIAKEALNDT